MDSIFLLGIFFLPFENFFFAPSSGWAAISPIVFFVYILFNWRVALKSIVRYRKVFVIFCIGILITLLNLFYVNDYVLETLSRTFSTLISIGLGFTSLMSFDIYFIQKKRQLEKVEKVIILAYMITFVFGIVEFCAIKFELSSVKELIIALSKRSYLKVNRVQFFFTEPSFIGMHLYGILLPVYICGKNKKILGLIFAYVIGSICMNAGVRIIVDTALVCGIYVLYQINLKKAKNIILVCTGVIALIVGTRYVYSNNARVAYIVDTGVYADGSFASRWFRVNASIKGYKKNILHALVGYGYGNEILPLKVGYEDAAKEYHNKYMKEVRELRNAEKESNESCSYCFYIRLISEMGLVVFAFVLYLIWKVYRRMPDKEWKALWVIVLYLYIQFEPYAFYSIWLIPVLGAYKSKCWGKQEKCMTIEK